MSEKTTFQVLLDMAPEDRKSDIEQVFREYKQIENENDGLFQILLAMGLYHDYFHEFPKKLVNVQNSILKAVEINARIKQHILYLTLAVYIGVFFLITTGFCFFLTSSLECRERPDPAPQEEKGRYRIKLPEYFQKGENDE